ncbi:MAG: aspartate--tRNA ligase [Planctomycetes bacterium]|nr:aspartate--tRNA ligase [Planctomycetota bacterium]
MAAARRAGDWRRTHTCGELRPAHVGQTVTLNGWVHKRRDHGGIYFVDLRDRYGLTQVVLGAQFSEALKLSGEDVIGVTGTVVVRDASNVNKERETGAIEVVAESLAILSKAKTPPIDVAASELPAVDTRLKYRYLDLRRPALQKNLIHRARLISAMRAAFERESFVEVETPVLTKATPEGARDYLVPSRVHPGSFFALPQSPQIFKQLLMVAGMDKYFQVARCFRDEDLRADRQPDFTQLDMEMSFVEEEDVFAVWERVLAATFREAMGIELVTPFPRLRHAEALERYGSDKPDVRFGLELVDVAAWAKKTEFKVFLGALERGGRVLGLNAGNVAFSRKEIEEGLNAVAALGGAKGLAWWKADAGGGTGSLARFAAGPLAGELMQLLSAKSGDLCLFVADAQSVARKSLNEVRLHLRAKLNLVDPKHYAFTWVTHFPLFTYDEDAKRWFSEHHPFTAPEDWALGGPGADPGQLMSRSYDLVMNGWELGSGSIRIHRSEVQERVFEILGIGPEERQEKFGFLLEALSYGAPPHGGFALGLDRTAALTAGLDNIRDVIAFPKTASAADLMCQAPSPVRPENLAEVHIQLAGQALTRAAKGAAAAADLTPK